MPLPRFRIRTLMIAVAVVGLGLWAHSLRKLSAEYRRRASAHVVICVSIDRSEPRALEWERRCGEYHAAMREKWMSAARHPWLPVEPDPPEPAPDPPRP